MRPPWEELEPALRDTVERQRSAARHLERFATTVCAASMALQMFMVLNWAQESARDAATASQSVLAVWPAVCSGMLGLLVLLSCWLLYHLELHYVSRSSGILLLIHVLFLPLILLVPLSTALLYDVGVTTHTVLLLTGNVLVLHVLLLLAWHHAVVGGLLFGSDMPRRVVWRLRFTLRLATLAVLLACALSLMSAEASLAALIAVLTAEVAVVSLRGYTLEPRPPDAARRTAA